MTSRSSFGFSFALRRAFCQVLSCAFRSSSISVSAAILILLITAPLRAQSARPALISQAVNEADRVALKGNVASQTAHATDLGAVPSSMPANRMMLLLARTPDREQALRASIQSLHDSNSANFHKWLTPAQFGAQWGAADSDIAAVTAWLQSHGFQVKGANAAKTSIEFSGTAGQVQQAFHTSIHTYLWNGETHHANVSAPQIPTALAPVVAGITTLNDFHPISTAQKGPTGTYDAQTHRAHAAYTGTSGSTNPFLYVGPADAATIYNVPNPSLNPAATTIVTGAGAKIGIVSDSNISLDQVANYRKLFGLPAATVNVVSSTLPVENTDALGAYVGAEIAGGIAPGAQLYFYTEADTDVDSGLNLAIIKAINDNLVDVLNVNFSSCEASLAYAGNTFYASMWEQAAAQGISVVVPTGDTGSAGCDNASGETSAIYGLQVNGVASTAFNIAVGGTDFAALAGPDGGGQDFSNYVDTTDPANATLRSALKYIPEVPWNDSSSNYPPGLLSAATPQTGTSANIKATGGGVSNCSQGYVGTSGLVCDGHYLKPSWQSALTPADDSRDLPDVSLFSGDGLYNAAWAICTDSDLDSNGNLITDCTPGSDGLPAGDFHLQAAEGTSTSAAAFSGILALVVSSKGRQGQANFALYNLAATVPTVFHDIATGNNSVPCESGTADCSQNAAGSLYLSGYDAATNYDLATGLGSVDASALISNWASASLTSTSTSLDLTPQSIEHGQIVTANATVTASGGTPTGDIALTASNGLTQSIYSYPKYSSIPLVSNGSTGDVSINYLPGGTYSVTAHYGGSDQFAGSTSPAVRVTVAPENSTTTLAITSLDPSNPAVSIASSSAPYGYGLHFTATPYGNRSPVVNGTVQPDGIPTGTVTFSSGGTTFQTLSVSSTGFSLLNAPVLPFTPGNYTIHAAYSGDNSFNASTGSANITIVRASPRISLVMSTPTANVGQTVTFTVTLNTDSLGVAPTGPIILKSGSTTLTTSTLVGTNSSGTTLASATVAIPVTNLPDGVDSIQAYYLGDTNYTGATSTASSIIVGKAPTSLSLSTPANQIPGEPIVFTALLHSNSLGVAPTGTVNLVSGGTVLTQATLVGASGSATAPASGTAILTVASLPVGADAIQAIYLGDSNYASSTSAATTLNSAKVLTQLVLTSSATQYAGTAITFTAKLSSGSVGVAPTGTVSLMSGTTTLKTTQLAGVAGSSTTTASGTATFSISSFPEDTTQIVAVYSGDTFYAASTSSALKINIRPAFTLESSSVTISSERGTAAQTVLTTSVGGYAGTINYTCALIASSAGSPPQCAMDPSSETITADGTIDPLILIFGAGTKLPTGVTVGSNLRRSNLPWLGAGGAVLAGCLLWGIPARRRKWRAMLSVLLLLAAAGGFSACSRPGKFISAGNYTFQVTGTDSKDASITATATVTVTVK